MSAEMGSFNHADLMNGDLAVIDVEMMGVADERVSLDYAPERALEIFDDANMSAGEAEASDESEIGAEIETAEEVSHKNGVYHEIKRKLNERFSIPPHEIAFIHDADTPAKKAALFRAVNSGCVRVLIGSTSKLGTGVNVQKRLVALHHVDEPWKPAELEQREGRILRQGNIYPEAFIFHYVTERSFDGYMLQTLESKARFISQIMAGEVTARTAEDVGDMVLTVAQVKAIASGNPLVQQRIESEVKLVKLDRLRAAFYNNRAAMRADLEELPERITAKEAEVAGHETAIKARLPLAEDSFSISLKKSFESNETSIFDKRERAGAHLRCLAEFLMERLRHNTGGAGGTALSQEVGSYRGFQVFVHVSGNSRFAGHSTLFNYQAEIHLHATDTGTTYIAQIGESNVGITQSVDYQLRHLEDRLEQAHSGLEILRARLATVTAEVDKSWAHSSEYARLRRRYDEMGKALQSQGIEIESNTTFSGEEANTDERAETLESDSDASAEPQGEAVDELAARQHPYTGLEDFAIVVEEASDSGFDKEQKSDAPANVLVFDFEASGTETEATNEALETDIFLQPMNEEDASSKETGLVIEPHESSSPADEKDDGGGDDDAMWQIAEPTGEGVSLTSKTALKYSGTKQSKKAKPQAETAQIGFLW